MTTPRDSRPGGWPPGMPSTGPVGPSGQAYGGPLPIRPAHDRTVEVEFAPAEPTIRVVGVPNPGTLPPAVGDALIDLARACRDAYGMGVEVTASGYLDEVHAALDLIRRHVDR